MEDKIVMNMDILNIIHAVIDYKRFIISNNYIMKENNFDWFSKTKDYYNSLPLPDGMHTNLIDFNKIIDFYDSKHGRELLLKLDDCLPEQLYSYYWS